VHLLHLPRLGQTMQFGMITAWLRDVGDAYDVEAELYEVETEKNAVEVVAKLPGTIVRLVAPTQEELPIGALLAVVADPGETLVPGDIDEAVRLDLERIGAGTGPAADPGPAATAPSGAVPSPAAEVPQRAAPESQPRAMPRARALARESGLSLSGLVGSGSGGSITVADVEHALQERGSQPAGGPDAGAAVWERRPLVGIARAMADNLTASWREVPQFVQQVEVDASAMVQVREKGRGEGQRLTFTDLLVHALAAAVQEVPEANARYSPSEIILFSDVNVGVAVATDRGLVVPVLHRVQDLSLPEISQGLVELAARARGRGLEQRDTSDGTITVSNLGQYGVQTGVPLVQAPHAAIAFAGAVLDRPVVVGGTVEVRPVMGLALGYDHRVLDGVTAARFTGAVRRHLEELPGLTAS